jgi:hypothetical protein
MSKAMSYRSQQTRAFSLGKIIYFYVNFKILTLSITLLALLLLAQTQ